MIRIPIRAAAGEYQVLVDSGLLVSTAEFLREAGLSGNFRLAADENAYRFHGAVLEESLRAGGYQIETHVVPSGESSKSMEMASRLYDWLIETGTERRDLLLVLGGGVAGDLAGFVAATFLRGIRLVQLPTTLLSQVDSSVGGKVAINHPRGKNLIGAFYPPSLVVADVATLGTLPPRELSAAMAEVVKMAAILDAPFYERLERSGEALLSPGLEAMEGVIARSIELKAGVVEQDEKEAGLRAVLNFGHTIGHAVEAVTGYGVYRHGEAVSVGMIGATRIAAEMGIAGPNLARRLATSLSRLGLPTSCPGLSVDRLMESMSRDKKASQGRLAWVLPTEIGEVTIRRDVPPEAVSRVLEELAG